MPTENTDRERSSSPGHGESGPGVRARGTASWKARLFGLAIAVIAMAVAFGMVTESGVVLPGWLEFRVPENVDKVCVVEDKALSEVSGLACSRTVPGSFWMHNDSGDAARLFLVSPLGRTQAIVKVAGQTPRDWEDLCSFEADGRRWLLIGDVGDNARVRGEGVANRAAAGSRTVDSPSQGGSNPAIQSGKDDSCRLTLIEEPELRLPQDGSSPVEETVAVTAVLKFRYPEGPVNCECLAVDVERREILLLTKVDPVRCRLYSMPLRFESNGPGEELTEVASPGVAFATAMDVSPDGRRLAVVNMVSGVLVERGASESWSEACRRPARMLELPPRRQGETVCFTLDGSALLLNSEFVNQPLWKLHLTETEPREPHNEADAERGQSDQSAK